MDLPERNCAQTPPLRSRNTPRRCFEHRHRWLFAVVVCAQFIVASGCTSLCKWSENGFKVGPEYCKPPAPVAQEWIESGEPEVEDRHLADWWMVFDDPKLNELIQAAYEQNVSLRVIGMRVIEARAQQAIAVGNIFPQTQQAMAQYGRIALSANQANNPTVVQGLLPPGSPALFTNFFSDWQAGFNLSWELDFWGRFRRNIESANAEFDASVENYDAALVTLFADVAAQYTRYRVSDQRIEIARANVKIQEEALALAQEKFRVGTTSRLDVEQARTVLEQTRASIPALEIVRGQANDLLCILMGIPPHDLADELGPSPPIDKSPMPSTPTWVAAGVPADLIRKRPDIRSAERQIAAQSAQIGVAEADLYPSFFINGNLGYEAQNLSQLFESQSFIGTIIPAFRWNILNYGRIVNNVRLQQAETLELVAAYQDAVLRAGREAQSALRGYIKSREQAVDLARAVDAAASASQLGIDQYRTGTVPFNTVFNLETAQVQQQDQLAVAQGNIALNLIEVYRSLGGGWEWRLQSGENGEVCYEIERPAPPPADAIRSSRVERVPRKAKSQTNRYPPNRIARTTNHS
jgi:NodT family efflux transporter outer membrane factor (OMF) lipoprotein